MHLLAVRAGLMGNERRAEQAGGFLLHVVDGFDHLDAAGLAATAGMDLRLDDPHRTGKLLGGFHRLIDGERRDAFGTATPNSRSTALA